MKVISAQVEYPNPLVNKYLTGFPEAAGMFEHNPHEWSSFGARYAVIQQDYHTDRALLVRILTGYNKSLGCGQATLENLARLAEEHTTVVITGQQAGVLTGPLYTVYKAITVIQLAREVARRTGRPVVPVFWVAAEDHDYAEIDHLDFIDREQKLTRLKLDYQPAGRYSVGHMPVTEAVNTLIDRLAEGTNPSEWKDLLNSRLKELAQEQDNLADWFAAVMAWLFRNHGLVMVNPLNKDLRRLWSGTFARFLQNTEAVNKKLQQGAALVRALGAEPQVEKGEDNVNLFIYVNGERVPLLKKEGYFTARGLEMRWTLAELLEIAENQPELLSPNVVLRPVAQDVLLPIIAYVAGPGEISYYALYREIYPIFNQRMPVIYPRTNITLVERAIGRHMEKYGIDFTNGWAGVRQKLKQHLAEADRLGIEQQFAQGRREIRKIYTGLIDRIAAVDPELSKHGSESLNRIIHQTENFEKKAHQHHRKACDLVVKRFQGVENQLFPAGNWQERVFNIFPYLYKYGPDLLESLIAMTLPGDFRHKLIYLGE